MSVSSVWNRGRPHDAGKYCAGERVAFIGCPNCGAGCGPILSASVHDSPGDQGAFRRRHERPGATIAVVVASLDRLDKILPAVKDLAVRHVGYGVEDRHYAKVGEALIWTLEAGLGEAFTPQ